MNFPTLRFPLRALFLPAVVSALALTAAILPSARAEMHEMFATKAEAQKRAKQLKCEGVFAMGNEWMPCKDFATYQKAVRKGS